MCNQESRSPNFVDHQKLKVAGAVGGSVLIYSDTETYHIKSADALALANEIKLMSQKVIIEVQS